MKTKRLVGIAVASALMGSYGAVANDRLDRAGDYGALAVTTPFSPNETGPAEWPQAVPARGEYESERATPLASSDVRETTTDRRAERADRRARIFDRFDRRAASDRSARTVVVADVASRSLPNPYTPWSPLETGLNTFNEDLQRYDAHVAEVERARLAVAEWNANAAPAPAAAHDGYAAGMAPTGATAGTEIRSGSGTALSQQGTWRTEPVEQRSETAGAPREVERTSAVRTERHDGVPVTQYTTSGLVESPAAPAQAPMPAHPERADVALTGRTELEHAGGSTASVADGASGVAPAEPAATEAEPRSADSTAASAFVSPDFAGSAPLQASGEQAASTTESRERQRGESPAL